MYIGVCRCILRIDTYTYHIYIYIYIYIYVTDNLFYPKIVLCRVTIITLCCRVLCPMSCLTVMRRTIFVMLYISRLWLKSIKSVGGYQ